MLKAMLCGAAALMGAIAAHAGDPAVPLDADTTAAPAPTCGTRAALLSRFSAEYGERPAGVGVTSIGYAVELLAAPDGTSWSLLIVRPDGWACLIEAGESWQAVVLPGEPV